MQKQLNISVYTTLRCFSPEFSFTSAKNACVTTISMLTKKQCQLGVNINNFCFILPIDLSVIGDEVPVP